MTPLPPRVLKVRDDVLIDYLLWVLSDYTWHGSSTWAGLSSLGLIRELAASLGLDERLVWRVWEGARLGLADGPPDLEVFRVVRLDLLRAVRGAS